MTRKRRRKYYRAPPGWKKRQRSFWCPYHEKLFPEEKLEKHCKPTGCRWVERVNTTEQ